jgi:hypothetical protein
MLLIRLFLGIVMLVRGRRLYWLFLGVVGFVLAFDLADHVIQGQPQSVKLVFAVIVGAVGAVLAVTFQKIAVLAGGFFAGGYLFVVLMKELGVRTAPYHWLLFIAGGLVGAFLMSALFGWTLVVLSSAVGAVLILQAFHFRVEVTHPLFLLLLVLGIAMQYGLIRRKPSSR